MRRNATPSLLRCAVVGSLVLAGCSAEGAPGAMAEGLLGMLMTLVCVVVVCLGLAGLVLAAAASLLAAGGGLITWNLLQPSALTRVLGLVAGAVTTAAGLGTLVCAGWAMVRPHGGHLGLDFGSGRVLAPLGLLLLATGPAAMLAALWRRRSSLRGETDPDGTR